MEVLNGAVYNSISCKFNNTHVKKSQFCTDFKPKLQSFCNFGSNYDDNDEKSRNFGVKVVNSGYENKGHLEYYGEIKSNKKGKKGWNEVSTKKKMKLLKGLSKNLSNFSELGFGLSFDDDVNQGFVDDNGDDKSMIISKAAEVLLAQLKQLKSEEEKQKKNQKEEKKKCKNDIDSSSSSSESSDSECGEVVDLKRLRNASLVQPIEANETLSTNIVPLPTTSINDKLSVELVQSCCNMILETTLNKDPTIEVLNSNNLTRNVANVGKRIEVCMGGKCKKIGAPALIEEFQKAVGDEGVVVGCKCMGKCKSAPNVKLSNAVGVVGESFGDDSMRTPSNPLYIGVGLEDVELIVSSYFESGQSIAGVVAS
ncbi:hypothetical protein RND81_12G076900 [Saponaria officinalis]|uniref:Uncharacterized protein n=1 Tax=Saponaria officinalis TaxID=3572 RepID=A0AAW1H7U1_SAPOF